MPQEIERKFLVSGQSWRESVRASGSIRQGYITRGPDFSVRVRTLREQGFLTIKSTTPGATRLEFEYEIPLAHAEELLQCACTPPLIEKIRYEVEWGGLAWCVDEFHGALSGLVLAEVELASPDQTLQTPPWAGREVTSDPAYRNERLASG